jgi:hypothetical protein
MSKPLDIHSTGDIVPLINCPGTGAYLVTVAATAKIPSSVAGYAPGCILIDQEGATINDKLYVNAGTSASCTFTKASALT